ncbi:MAG: hypothetical protein AAF206_13150 [Bacteroidota bacterium]
MAQKTFIHHSCPECGSNLKYGAGRRKLVCTNCSYSRNLQQNSTQVAKRNLSDGVKLEGFEKGLYKTFQEVHCKSCGTYFAAENHTVINQCPYCGGTEFENSTRQQEVFQPYNIIPFTIPRKFVEKKLRRFLSTSLFGGNPFLPSGIGAVTKPDRLKGVYIPAFMMDAFVRTTWKAELAMTYMEQRGKKQVKKTIWEPTAGYFEHFYSDLFFPISHGGDQGWIEQIPWNTRELVAFDSRYMGDWWVELYQNNEMDAFVMADLYTDADAEGKAMGRMPDGEGMRKYELNSEKMSLTFKHVLVPLWATSFEYKGEIFQYFINGQTGKMVGEKPLSNTKIYILVAAIILLLSSLILLST